jgi:hypothetical protein
MDRLMSELFTDSHHFAAACAMALTLNVLFQLRAEP